MMEQKSIGAMCRQYRAERLLSQAALAALCGVHVNTIGHAERGETLSLLTTAKIERILKNEMHKEE